MASTFIIYQIHLHPYYKNNLGTKKSLCPVAENIYKRIITLPIFPTMTEGDIEDVIGIVKKVVNYFTSNVNKYNYI